MTFKYCAPEINFETSVKIENSADIFSLGMLLFFKIKIYFY